MSGVSNYALDLVAGVLVNHTSMPSTVYIALVTSEPFMFETGSDLLEPPVDVGYSRQSYTLDDAYWTEASSGATRNVNEISFTQSASGYWGRIVAWVMTTADTDGQILFWGTLDEGIEIDTGSIAKITAGSIEMSVVAPSISVAG
jgi:hypothetical protein